jgi:Type IV secretion system pilin
MLNYHNRQRLIKRIIFWAIVLVAILALFIPNLVRARMANDPTDDPCVIFNSCINGIKDMTRPTDSGDFAQTIILQIAGYVAFLSGSLAVLFIVLGAWNMMSSNGDAAKFKKGYQSMLYAIIGLVVIAASWGIVASVLSFLRTSYIGGNP